MLGDRKKFWGIRYELDLHGSSWIWFSTTRHEHSTDMNLQEHAATRLHPAPMAALVPPGGGSKGGRKGTFLVPIFRFRLPIYRHSSEPRNQGLGHSQSVASCWKLAIKNSLARSASRHGLPLAVGIQNLDCKVEGEVGNVFEAPAVHHDVQHILGIRHSKAI